ncbi:toxin VasX [Marinobacter subterrani]|uniref:toxin VasX n=1 Tax=Marinobacter subterrani TaxID=1658765 RepID=UPI0023579A20|nr:toxin VasX [Marinobacter subterrani]
MGKQLTNPIVAADRASLASTTAQGACPLTRTDIQLIPVRYAYADEAAEHPSLEPRFNLEFQPIGIRQIRDGYLYLFHSDAPDILHEYEVKDGGAVSKRLWQGNEAAQDQRTGTPDTPAIVVPRRGHVDAFFSSTQLTAKKCSMLIRWEDYRRQVMQRVSLSGYCPIKGKPQLLSKTSLESLLTHPAEQAVPMDGKAHLPSWYWAQNTLDKGSEPFAHRLAAYDLDHAYLVVDDLMGHIDDLLDAWAIVDTNHNAWLEAEDAKYYPARFISDLIRLDDERVAELARAFSKQVEDDDAKDLFEKVARGSRVQHAQLKELIEDFPEYQRSARKVAGPSTYNYMPSDHERVTRMRGGSDALATDLGLSQRELLSIVESMSDYQSNLVDGSDFSGEQGIADLVKLDEMNVYLEQAQHQLSTFSDEKRRIVTDIQSLLATFYLHGHLYDRESDSSYMALLTLDNALMTVLTEWAQSSGDFSFLKRFYFEEIGHQHLISLDLKPEIIPGALKDLIDGLKAIMNARQAPAAYKEWVQLVEQSAYLQYPSLSEGAAAQLSHHLAQLNITGRLALFELVQAADAADLHGRLKQVFERMDPGLRAHIFENQRLYQIDLEIADADSLTRHESLVKEIERLATLREEVLNQESRLQQRHSEATTRDRRRYKREYDEQIRAIRAQKNELTHQLRERGFQLIDTSPLEGENHSGALLIGGLTRTAYGRAVQSEVDELKRLRDRGGLTRMMDYGRGMIHGQDTLDLPKRIGGMGFVSFMGMVGAVGAWDAFNKWDKDGSTEELLTFASSAAGTIGAAASILTIVGSARLNYYYLAISQADEVLTRLARMNVWGGTVAAWAGFLSAGADWFKQLAVMVRSGSNNGTRTGAGVTLVGDSMLAYGSWKMAKTGTVGLFHRLVDARGVVWKPENGKLLSWKASNGKMLDLAGGLFRGLNAWLWVGTILVCIGNWVQSYFKRTDVQRWCEQSIWGNANSGWEADQQRQELAKAIYKPTALVKAERAALNGRTSYCAFRLELPGLSSLQSDNMEWAILRQEGTVWAPDQNYWNQAITVRSLGAAGVALELYLTEVDLETADGFYLAFRYKAVNSSNWLPEMDKAYHYKLILHEPGNLPSVGANERKEWQPVKALDSPDHRLSSLITTYHALAKEPKTS